MPPRTGRRGHLAAVIAARWGIRDPKHLGRALKREFGTAVSDLRRGFED